jgi:general secretion pathway protein J
VNASRNTARAEAGFTLIELLVAVTVVAFIAVLLFGGLRLATRSGDAVDRRLADTRQVALAYDFMTNELAGAQPLTTDGAASDAPVDFVGEPDAVGFVTLLPPDLGVGGFFRVRAALDDEGRSGRRLMVAWEARPQPGATPAVVPGRPSVLLDDVRSIAFAYFGVAAPNAPAAWNDRWTNHQSLPRLVRLRIVLADGAETPDLIVAPRLAGPPLP